MTTRLDHIANMLRVEGVDVDVIYNNATNELEIKTYGIGRVEIALILGIVHYWINSHKSN